MTSKEVMVKSVLNFEQPVARSILFSELLSINGGGVLRYGSQHGIF